MFAGSILSYIPILDNKFRPYFHVPSCPVSNNVPSIFIVMILIEEELMYHYILLLIFLFDKILIINNYDYYECFNFWTFWPPKWKHHKEHEVTLFSSLRNRSLLCRWRIIVVTFFLQFCGSWYKRLAVSEIRFLLFYRKWMTSMSCKEQFFVFHQN